MEGLKIYYISCRKKYFSIKYVLITVTFILVIICSQGCMQQDFLLGMESSLFNTADKQKNIYKSTDTGPKPGGNINIFSTLPDTLNPLLTLNQYVKDFLELICEPLVLLDNNQKPVPWLCSSWNYSNDGLIFSVQLRKTVEWHDGSKLTSFDVINTLDMISSSKTSIYRPLLNNIASYEAKDYENIVFYLKKPYVFTPYCLIFPIIHKNTAKNSYSIIGTGPYSVKSHVPDKYVILEKNENWWYNEANENLSAYPFIESIKIKFYDKSTDPIKTFLINDTDIAFINSTRSEDIIKYSKRPDINILSYPTTKLELVSINSKSLNLTNNIKKLVKDKMRNTQLTQMIPKPVLRVSLPFWPRSFINSLVENDAYNDIYHNRDMDEIDSKLFQGVKQINIIANKENPIRVKMSEYLADKLKEHGINTNLQILPWNEYFKSLSLLQYDFAFLGCDLAYIPDISYLYSRPYIDLYASSNQPCFNFSDFEDDAADILINKFLSMRFEDINYSGILNEFFNIVDNKIPYITLFVFQEAIMTDRKIRAVSHPLPWRRLNDLYKWYISGE